MADQADGPVIRPFAEFLLDHHSGRTAVELAEKMHELVAAVQATEKGGVLTLSIKVEPLKDDVDTLVVTADVKVKKPEFKRRGAIFFPDADGNLQRSNPAAGRLPLREVGGPKIEPENEHGQVLDVGSKAVEGK